MTVGTFVFGGTASATVTDADGNPVTNEPAEPEKEGDDDRRSGGSSSE